MASAELAHYNQVCQGLYGPLSDDAQAAVNDAWAAMPLRTRLRVIFTVPWRDAVTELAAAVTARRGGA